MAKKEKTVIEYQLIRSRRKTIGIEITPEGQIIVRAPQKAPVSAINEVLRERYDWILEHRQKAMIRKKEKEDFLSDAEPITIDEVRELADRMQKEFVPRVREYARKMGITYGGITIRNQRTRWGSCSSIGNLNFNCLLMLTPVEIQDYVIVHELCHRIEMNHSKRFWQLVESAMPDYKARRKWLKDEGKYILMRAFQ
jgi:predicted metal-dependent hydrolase